MLCCLCYLGMMYTLDFPHQPYHMVASALNAFHNVFLKQVKGEEWSIAAYNHPLPRTEKTKVPYNIAIMCSYYSAY